MRRGNPRKRARKNEMTLKKVLSRRNRIEITEFNLNTPSDIPI